MNFEVIEQEIENAKIKVVGVGGGGGNAVLHMINHNIAGVDSVSYTHLTLPTKRIV